MLRRSVATIGERNGDGRDLEFSRHEAFQLIDSRPLPAVRHGNVKRVLDVDDVEFAERFRGLWKVERDALRRGYG